MTSNGHDTDAGDKGRIGGAYDTAREKAADAYTAARDKTSAAYEAAREKTGSAYSSAREAASGARERAAAGIEDNPLAALIGGLALGALAGALLPRSEREIAALSPLGDRLRTAAGNASTAAKAAATDKIVELGVPKDLVEKAKSAFAGATSKAGGTAETDERERAS